MWSLARGKAQPRFQIWKIRLGLVPSTGKGHRLAFQLGCCNIGWRNQEGKEPLAVIGYDLRLRLLMLVYKYMLHPPTTSNQSRLEAYRHALRFSRLIRRLSVRRQRVRVRSTVMNPVLPASAHAFTSSPEARSHERLETVERNDDKPMCDWGGLGDDLLEAPALRTMTKFNQLHRCGKVVMPRI